MTIQLRFISDVVQYFKTVFGGEFWMRRARRYYWCYSIHFVAYYMTRSDKFNVLFNPIFIKPCHGYINQGDKLFSTGCFHWFLLFLYLMTRPDKYQVPWRLTNNNGACFSRWCILNLLGSSNHVICLCDNVQGLPFVNSYIESLDRPKQLPKGLNQHLTSIWCGSSCMAAPNLRQGQ